MGEDAEALFRRGAQEIIDDQIAAGIDIPTDGEVRRENYIHYHCRHLDGIDFGTLTAKEVRGGAYRAELPSIVGPVRAGAPFLPHDWRVAQNFTDRPVKVTMPGPMTIADTTANLVYDDERQLGTDLAEALNAEIRALAEAGCTWIQVDEPVLARKPDQALDYGIEQLDRCFHGLPAEVNRVMHMCCGYPDMLDRDDYPKADPGSYVRLAEAVERAAIDVVSLEDAHRPNDLARLLAIATTPRITLVLAKRSSSARSFGRCASSSETTSTAAPSTASARRT